MSKESGKRRKNAKEAVLWAHDTGPEEKNR